MADGVQFETINSEEISFGTNNFLEIAKKKAVTSEGETVFISISRGFTTPNGEKRFRKSVSFPDEDDVIKAVSDAIKKVTK